jgi:hypothetical protein|tara:strand:+ start:1364 stop:1600 length:237 start_codon:yes stop_codon:yes gene_type:complete
MTLELKVDGYFDFTVCSLGTEVPVDDETAQGVLDNLQQAEYTIGMRTRTIFDINDLQNPIYSFVIEATNNTEYEFDEY